MPSSDLVLDETLTQQSTPAQAVPLSVSSSACVRPTCSYRPSPLEDELSQRNHLWVLPAEIAIAAPRTTKHYFFLRAEIMLPFRSGSFMPLLALSHSFTPDAPKAFFPEGELIQRN
jgi:hypothetical protein